MSANVHKPGTEDFKKLLAKLYRVTTPRLPCQRVEFHEGLYYAFDTAGNCQAIFGEQAAKAFVSISTEEKSVASDQD